jgi:hypothetical protein
MSNLTTLSESKHSFYQVQISRTNQAATSQVAFSFGTFLSQQVTFESVIPLNLSAPGNLKGLLRPGMSLYFGHLTSNLDCKGKKIIEILHLQYKLFINVSGMWITILGIF